VAADGLVRSHAVERLSRPQDVEVDGSGGWVAAGTGWAAYPEMIERLKTQERPPRAIHGTLLPRAEEIAHLGAAAWREGAGVDPERALPVYLRDRVTHNMSQKT
jgi:tRNA threonylcarbamoyladenosine biosynthesis protein TsaB